MQPFHNPYSHGFIRAAACVPAVRVADPEYNAQRTIDLARRASESSAAVALFPELGISAYSNEDLFQQNALLDGALIALRCIVAASRELIPILVVGVPLRWENKLFNCAVVIYRGRILGVTPKSYLPNYREFYERRQFVPARHALSHEIAVLDTRVPFGHDLIYEITNVEGFALHVEICEDLWVPIPPSTYAALAGATVLANLSASNVTIGKADYRRSLCGMQSAKCIAAYLYTCAGAGESTTDLAWDGHAMIYENYELLAQAERFAAQEQMICADIDLDRLIQERSRMTSFHDTVADHHERLQRFRHIPFEFQVPGGSIPLLRKIERFPYVPSDPATRDERCREVLEIQAQGLISRLRFTGLQKLVIGVSGGLDSAHALMICALTMDRLGLPRNHILAYTLPGYATSAATHAHALRLMQAVGASCGEIDIRPACLQMFKDLGHPFAEGKTVYDITFENVQAGERTSHLFRLANMHQGLLVGTGDLSELALGWCTYGVGDHMSHYNVNASVPKTLIQHLIRWLIASRQLNAQIESVLQRILDGAISPELVPGDQGAAQSTTATEVVIGPYVLHDFALYYLSRYGYRPSKVAFLAAHAWGDKTRGTWPDTVPDDKRYEYDLATIRRWLDQFLVRFFQTSQFKRSCLPNGPKVGSGGSLSPRGDWRAPSDAQASIWSHELRHML